jgi:hypothetical protein
MERVAPAAGAMAGGARVRVSTVVRLWIWEPEGEETMGDRCGLAGLV